VSLPDRAAVRQAHLKAGGSPDDVGVGDDVALVVEHDPGADRPVASDLHDPCPRRWRPAASTVPPRSGHADRPDVADLPTPVAPPGRAPVHRPGGATLLVPFDV
jgi:hypothetical protein